MPDKTKIVTLNACLQTDVFVVVEVPADAKDDDIINYVNGSLDGSDFVARTDHEDGGWLKSTYVQETTPAEIKQHGTAIVISAENLK